MTKKTSKSKPETTRFPSTAEILRFIEESPTPVGKREIARAFKIKGADRPRLKEVLRELKQSGNLERHAKRQLASPGRLPEVAVIEVVDLDEDGELVARPANWKAEQGPPPIIYVTPDKQRREALATGERLLAKLTRSDDIYEARVIRRLGKGGALQVLGIYEPGTQGGRLKPVDKKAKQDFLLAPEDAAGAQPGELVLAEAKGHHRRMGLRDVRVIERHGSLDNHRALSLISIHEQGLPTVFPEAALREAEEAEATPLDRRTDLRGLPLVTIDGADARDFDDAVFAEPDDRKENAGGWHLIVAIADVAHYVRPDSALDREAYKRGNSAYFPDRVVPMLPEALSNGWCSLNPQEDRGCLAAHLWIAKDGKLQDHRFERGLMRSAARLTYEEVQEARNGHASEKTGPLLEPVIAPLYGAFEALLAARKARGTLDLDVPERQVIFGEDGQIAEITTRQRLDSHRLIEEFMIAANVAAARE
ncbi:MAG: RNB domain-containing ribonuclease, partial [Rhodovibrionaceae bacterium]